MDTETALPSRKTRLVSIIAMFEGDRDWDQDTLGTQALCPSGDRPIVKASGQKSQRDQRDQRVYAFLGRLNGSLGCDEEPEALRYGRFGRASGLFGGASRRYFVMVVP